VRLTEYYAGDQNEKYEMSGACITFGGEQGCVQDFGGATWGNETTWKTKAQMGG